MILGRYRECSSSSLLERDFHLSCCSTIEAMRNLLSKPIIEFELAISSAIRPSRLRLSKGIGSIKRFNMRSYISSLPLITKQVDLSETRNSSVKKSPKRQNDNFSRLKSLSQINEANISIDRKTYKPMPEKVSSLESVTERKLQELPKNDSKERIVDQSYLLQPYPVMRIDDITAPPSNYKGMTLIDKYLNSIDGILNSRYKKMNIGGSPIKKENSRREYLSLGKIQDSQRKRGTLITEVVSLQSLEDLKSNEKSSTLTTTQNNTSKVITSSDSPYELSRLKKSELDLLSLRTPLDSSPNLFAKTPKRPLLKNSNLQSPRLLAPISLSDSKISDNIPKLNIKNLRLPRHIQSKTDSKNYTSSSQADDETTRLDIEARARNEPATRSVLGLVSPKALALDRNPKSIRKMALSLKTINIDAALDYKKIVEL